MRGAVLSFAKLASHQPRHRQDSPKRRRYERTRKRPPRGCNPGMLHHVYLCVAVPTLPPAAPSPTAHARSQALPGNADLDAPRRIAASWNPFGNGKIDTTRDLRRTQQKAFPCSAWERENGP